MKFAIEITETLQRTVIVDTDNYEDAERLVRSKYKKDLELNADNSNVNVSFSNITEQYIEDMRNEYFNFNNQEIDF